MNSLMKTGLVFLALSVPYVGCSRQPDPPRVPSLDELSALRELNEELRGKYEDLEKEHGELEKEYEKVRVASWTKDKQIDRFELKLDLMDRMGDRIIMGKKINSETYQRKMLNALDKIRKYEDVLGRNGFDSRLIQEGHGDLGLTEFENLKLRYERDQIGWEQQTLRFDKTERGLELSLERTKDENVRLEKELGAYKEYHQKADVWIREHQPNRNPLRN